MTRTTTTSILASVFVAISLAASPAMSQAAGRGGGGGPGPGGGGNGGGGYDPVISRVAPGGACIARCYRRPRPALIEEKPREYTCSVWHRIIFAGNPRCQESQG